MLRPYDQHCFNVYLHFLCLWTPVRGRVHLLFFFFFTHKPFSCTLTGNFHTFIDVLWARLAVGPDAEGKLILFQIDGQTEQRG